MCYKELHPLAIRILQKLPFVNVNWVYAESNRNTLYEAIVNDAPLELIDELLKRSDIQIHNTTADKAWSSMHLAVEKRRPDVIARLVKANANIHILDKKNISPLMLACAAHTMECLTAIIEHMTTDAKAKGYKQALFYSLTQRLYLATRAILEKWSFSKEFINDIKDSGMTPLHLAVRARAPLEVIYKMRCLGADPFAKDNKGNSPLREALNGKFKSIEKVLTNKESYLVDLNALTEFYAQYHLGHWSISILPMEILHLIAEHSGHDFFTIKNINNTALISSQQMLKTFSSIQLSPSNDPNRNMSTYEWLQTEYGSVPKAVEATISVLTAIQASPPPLDTVLTMLGFNKQQQRQAQIYRLSKLLRIRNPSNVASPAGF
jgi:ankyrin repeat protein